MSARHRTPVADLDQMASDLCGWFASTVRSLDALSDRFAELACAARSGATPASVFFPEQAHVCELHRVRDLISEVSCAVVALQPCFGPAEPIPLALQAVLQWPGVATSKSNTPKPAPAAARKTKAKATREQPAVAE